MTRTDAASQRILYENLELAKQLGGTPMEFRGKDVASTILAFAQEYGIKVIVVGKSNRPWHQRFWTGAVRSSTGSNASLRAWTSCLLVFESKDSYP